jgi:hypothetical protein
VDKPEKADEICVVRIFLGVVRVGQIGTFQAQVLPESRTDCVGLLSLVAQVASNHACSYSTGLASLSDPNFLTWGHFFPTAHTTTIVPMPP